MPNMKYIPPVCIGACVVACVAACVGNIWATRGSNVNFWICIGYAIARVFRYQLVGIPNAKINGPSSIIDNALGH